MKENRLKKSGRGISGVCRAEGQTQKTSLSGTYIAALAAASGAALMIFSPAAALESAEKAINLWMFTVLPSMFPFFFCTDLLIRSGMHIRLGRLFERPAEKIFGVPGIAGFVCISSVLSGYPAGARVLGELYGQGQLSRRNVREILTFCSTSGPLFVLGAVGAGMLHSEAAGYVILCAHYLGAFVTGLLLIRGSVLRRLLPAFSVRISGRRAAEDSAAQMQNSGTAARIRSSQKTQTRNAESFPEMMTGAILSSFHSLAVIGGYIIIFMIVTDAVAGLIDFLPEAAETAGNILTGCLEMTVGCSRAACSSAGADFRIILCTFIISFGGFSVAAQSMSVLKNSGVRPGYYLRFKLLQGLISAVCAGVITQAVTHFSGRTISVFESAGPLSREADKISLFSADAAASFYSLFFSSAACAAMMVFFCLAVILFSENGRKK